MKKILVYGLGDNYIKYEKWIRSKYEIVGYIDGDKEKQGKKLNGIEIKSVNDINYLSFEYVLVTPNDFETIEKNLVENGVTFNRIIPLVKEFKTLISIDKIKVCFVLLGGLGDCIISLNYIYKWIKKYGNDRVVVDIVSSINSNSIKQLGNYRAFFNEIFDYKKLEEIFNDYELIIELRRYPQVIKCDAFSIKNIAPNIIDYYLMCEKFLIFNSNLMLPDMSADGVSASYELEKKKKRFNQSDIYELLDIGEKYEYPITVDNSILNKYGLNDKKYITIHRGCDKVFFENNVKLWGESNYEELIALIACKYTSIDIVLVGDEYERSSKIKSHTIDLLGKTDIEGLEAVMANSILHIDTEGGLVHLRHAVAGGKSVVMFGPTNPDFFGYSENINIRTTECAEPCEWKTKDWAIKCCNENTPNICMKSITPKMVFEKISECLT